MSSTPSPDASGMMHQARSAEAAATGMPAVPSLPWWVSDVGFVVEGKRVQAHKVVLASRCRYFSRLFLASGEAEFVVNEFSYDSFSQFIRWLYSPPSDMPVESAMDLLRCAQFYEVPDLLEFCERLLAPSNVMITQSDSMLPPRLDLDESMALTQWSTDPVLFNKEVGGLCPPSEPSSAGGPFSGGMPLSAGGPFSGLFQTFGGDANNSFDGLPVC